LVHHQCSVELGSSLEEVAAKNNEKTLSRLDRGKVKETGITGEEANINTDQENQYVAELARISSTSVSITMKIVDVQLAMILRDLGVKGEARDLDWKGKTW
jgi:hypothetical protein